MCNNGSIASMILSSSEQYGFQCRPPSDLAPPLHPPNCRVFPACIRDVRIASRDSQQWLPSGCGSLCTGTKVCPHSPRLFSSTSSTSNASHACSTMPFERCVFESVLQKQPSSKVNFDMVYVTAKLDATTVELAAGATALCLFFRDRADETVLRNLHTLGVRLLVLRYFGTPAFDARMAAKLGLRVMRVPTKASTSVAEFAITLILSLGRRVHIAANRVRDGNFSLQGGLVGEDMENRIIGVIGTGEIGSRVVQILRGFDANVLAFDTIENPRVKAAGATYVTMENLLAESDVLTLHAPLVRGTRNMINEHTLSQCKKGVHIVNTSRAGLIDRKALVSALRAGRVDAVAMDVFEGESNLFCQDECGDEVDLDFQMLRSMPNVLITGHQAALTENAVEENAKLTIGLLSQFQAGDHLDTEIRTDAK